MFWFGNTTLVLSEPVPICKPEETNAVVNIGSDTVIEAIGVCMNIKIKVK